MGALARLGFLGIAVLVVVALARGCVPSRVVFPSPTPSAFAASATPSPNRAPTQSASGTATSPAAFSLTVTDAQLTQAAASAFPQTVSGVTVRDPVVRTTASGVRLVASARVFFGTTEFVMTGTPYASDGRVAVRVDSLTLGGLALPDSVRTQAAAAVESAIGRLVPPTVSVQKVTLGQGNITIEGATRR